MHWPDTSRIICTNDGVVRSIVELNEILRFETIPEREQRVMAMMEKIVMTAIVITVDLITLIHSEWSTISNDGGQVVVGEEVMTATRAMIVMIAMTTKMTGRIAMITIRTPQ